MSAKAARFFKIFIKVLGLAAAGASAYLFYQLLTVPWTYPILNSISLVLLAAVMVLGVLAALT